MTELFELLPEVHRRRDAEAGGQLRALLAIVAEQLGVVEAEVEQLYRDWFIETCQDWVVPYLGDLVGYRALPGVDPANPNPALLSPRRDVANTVANRRRKGTLALLEKLAADIAGWPARAVECYQLLGGTQPVRLYGGDANVNANRLSRGRLVDLRDGDALELLDGAFDRLAHTVDVSGRHNIPRVAVFVWRLRSHSLTRSPAPPRVAPGRHDYWFNPLGTDTPLVTVTTVPAFLRRREFADNTPDYYGPGKSLCVWRDDDPEPVPLADIVAADLTDWAYLPKDRQIAIDPVLGRLSFGPDAAPVTTARVTYHYATPDDTGGGEYPRPHATTAHYRVGPGEPDATITAALDRWQADKQADPTRQHAVIEIVDSGRYPEQLAVTLADGERLELRAADGARPIVVLDEPATFTGPAELVLDGLLIAGAGVELSGLTDVHIGHCTVRPGLVIGSTAAVTIGRSVLGPVQVGAAGTEPMRLDISDSVLDAGLGTVLGGPAGTFAYARLTLARATVLGRIRTHAVALIENSICFGLVRVARRQHGCVRFTWLPRNSRTPRQYHCHPASDADEARVRPRFTATQYGQPAYLQLAPACPDEIARGADDGAEMGAYHDMYQPQRADGLRQRLTEHTPASAEVGLVFIT